MDKNTSCVHMKDFLNTKSPLFGPPRSGWDLWFSLRPFVRTFGRDLENRSWDYSDFWHKVVT